MAAVWSGDVADVYERRGGAAVAELMKGGRAGEGGKEVKWFMAHTGMFEGIQDGLERGIILFRAGDWVCGGQSTRRYSCFDCLN